MAKFTNIKLPATATFPYTENTPDNIPPKVSTPDRYPVPVDVKLKIAPDIPPMILPPKIDPTYAHIKIDVIDNILPIDIVLITFTSARDNITIQ